MERLTVLRWPGPVCVPVHGWVSTCVCMCICVCVCVCVCGVHVKMGEIYLKDACVLGYVSYICAVCMRTHTHTHVITTMTHS